MLNKRAQLLVLLSKLKGVGNSTLRAVLPDINNGLSLQEIADKDSKIRKGIDSTPNYTQLLEMDLEACGQNGVYIISVFDSDFPEGLVETKNSPLFIYVKGNKKLLSQKSLAIIGTRNPDELACEYTKRISWYFSNSGIPILSGLALGCDSLAHSATLDAGGETIAVMGHGLHMIAPTQNQNLAERILDSSGLLVSEYPMGMAPTKYSYVQRDKTQAALSRSIILVQSEVDGVVFMHAAALKAGKSLFSTPH